jgi:hypothetical protein
MNVKALIATTGAFALLASPALAATTPKATSLSVHAAKGTVQAKARDTISGVLKSGKSPLGKQRVLLEEKAAGAKKFTVIAKATSSSKGAVSFAVYPVKGKDSYELVFSGTKAYKGSHSAVVVVTAK